MRCHVGSCNVGVGVGEILGGSDNGQCKIILI